MKKYALVCIFFSAWLLVPFNADGQLNRTAIKKNNRDAFRFSGTKRVRFPKQNRYTAITFSANALNYYGDLAPRPSKLSTDISFTRPALGLSVSKRIGPRYSVSASVMYGTLKGSDAESADRSDLQSGVYRSNRNLSFRNRINELSAVFVVDIFKNRSNYFGRARMTPYFFAGVAVFHHNPQALAPATDLNGNPLPQAGQWVDLRPLGTEGQFSSLLPTDQNYGIKKYSLIQPAIPFGVGIRFKVTEFLDFSADLGFRYLFTDYVDDVSRNYVDLGVLNGELARALSYRSNEVQSIASSQLLPTTVRDGSTYNLLPGYGAEYPTNNRGYMHDRDIYMVTSLRLTFILSKTSRNALIRLLPR